MKVGYTFKHRHKGKHEDVTLIILHDRKRNTRFLYNIDYEVRVGDGHLLYAKHIGKASKEDILKYTKMANAL